MNIPPDLIEMFSEFAGAGVRYLLVGGHAVSAHGKPRSTKDVDLWLAPDADNIERACDALHAFGVPPEIIAALRGAGVDDIVWLGRAPTRIDLLQRLPGVEFETAWRRRVVLELDGVSISVIGKEDLIRNKRSVGRAQDLRDVKALLRPVAPTRRRTSKKRGKR